MHVCAEATSVKCPLSFFVSLSTYSFEAGYLLEPGVHVSQLDWKPPSPCDSPISEPLRAGFLKDCQDTWVVMWVLGPELQA